MMISFERRTKEIKEYFDGTVTAVELKKKITCMSYMFLMTKQRCQMQAKAYGEISATEREQS
nr:hypothetical protein [Bacillus cereus]